MKIQTNTKHYRIAPIIILTLAIPAAIVGGWLAFANAFANDEAPPDDSMLQLPDVNIAEAANAYYDLQRANNAAQATFPSKYETPSETRSDQMLNGENWDEEYVTEMINRNAAVTADFRLAAGKERYQGLLGARPGNINTNDFANLSAVRFIAKLVALDSMRQAKNGEVAKGLAGAMDIIRLSHQMELSQATLIEYLVASSMKQIGLGALRQIALQTNLTTEQAKTIAQELEQYRNSSPGLVNAFKLEYAAFKSYQPQTRHLDTLYASYGSTTDLTTGETRNQPVPLLITVLEYSGLTRFYYWPNQTWRFRVDETRALVANAQADCFMVDLDPPLPTYSTHTGWGRLFEPNAIGKMIADIGRISYGGASTKRCNESAAISATQVALSVSAYKKAKGAVPNNLAILVPEYMSSVPVDPYNRGSLVYDPTRKIVYSVGQDRKDENGNTNKMNDYTVPGGDWQNMFDLVFPISK